MWQTAVLQGKSPEWQWLFKPPNEAKQFLLGSEVLEQNRVAELGGTG
jgi:hypothetical protein